MKHIIYAISLICLIQSDYTYSSSNQDFTFNKKELPKEVIENIKKHDEKRTAKEARNNKKSSIAEAAKKPVVKNRKNEANQLLTAQNTRQFISFSSKDSKIEAILSDFSKTKADQDIALIELITKRLR